LELPKLNHGGFIGLQVVKADRLPFLRPTTGIIVPTTGIIVPTTGIIVPTTGIIVPTTGIIVHIDSNVKHGLLFLP
jgi:hypothetical protein